MTSTPSRYGRWVGRCYAVLALFVWLGFALDSSRSPVILGYSRPYLVFLVACALVLAAPLALAQLGARLGWRRLLTEAGPTLGLVALCYLGAAAWYSATQEHPFDPYLQNPPALIADIERPREGGELRVVALGGSTTEASTLPEADRYPRRLQELLRTTGPSRRVEVFNAGRNWWTSKHSLIHYTTHVRRWRPDVVVVMHAINDLYRSFESDSYALGAYEPTWAHYYGPAITGARPPSFARFLLGRTARLIYLHWYSDWRIQQVDYPIARYRSLPEYERNLTTLAELVAADGGTLVVLTQGSLYKSAPSAAESAVIRFGEEFCMTRTGMLTAEYPATASLRRAMDAYNAAARRVAVETGAVLVDLDALLPRDLTTFMDDVHHTAAGSAIVARAVNDALATLPVVRGESDSH